MGVLIFNSANRKKVWTGVQSQSQKAVAAEDIDTILKQVTVIYWHDPSSPLEPPDESRWFMGPASTIVMKDEKRHEVIAIEYEDLCAVWAEALSSVVVVNIVERQEKYISEMKSVR